MHSGLFRNASIDAGVKQRGRRSLFAGAAVSALLLATPALTQTRAPAQATIRLPPVERPFNPDLLKYADQSPIPFRPFDRLQIGPPDRKTPVTPGKVDQGQQLQVPEQPQDKAELQEYKAKKNQDKLDKRQDKIELQAEGAALTSQPITSESMISLPNGRTVPASAFYDQLDESEKYLNSHGYSLRTMSATAPTTIASIPVDEAMFKEQLAKAPATTDLAPLPDFEATHSYVALTTPTPINMTPEGFTAHGLSEKLLTPEVMARVRALNASRASAVQLDGVVISPLETFSSLLIPQASMICLPFNSIRTWNQSVGNVSTFAAFVNASFSYDGLACSPPPPGQQDHQSHFSVMVEANAGGSVFNNTTTLLHMSGSLAGSQVTNQINAAFGVVMLGQTVASANQTYNGHWGVDNTVSHPVDFSSSVYIPIGPFSIHAVVGAQGQASLHYVLDLYPTSVNFVGTPNVSATAYAQVGLNAYVAEAGASANLTLVNWTGNVDAHAGMGVFNVPVAFGGLYADSNVNLLSGNLNAYVKYWVPNICHTSWWPHAPYPCLQQVQSNYNLFNWSGYHYNSVLFNQLYWTPL